MSNEVTEFLSANGLGQYIPVMLDQGFEELEDLRQVCLADQELRELIPPMGHRTKLRRLLGLAVATSAGAAATTGAVPPPPTTAADVVPGAPTSLTGTSSHARDTSSPAESNNNNNTNNNSNNNLLALLRRTEAVQWLQTHEFHSYAAPLQAAGYDKLQDLEQLALKQEALELLIQVPGHRDRFRRLLAPKTTEQWVVSNLANHPNPDLHDPSVVDDISSSKSEAVHAGGDYLEALFQKDGSTKKGTGASSSSVATGGAGAASGRKAGPDTVYVRELDQHYDKCLFVENPGLAAATKPTNRPPQIALCRRDCGNPKFCELLHFQTVELRHEYPCTCSVSYVTLITAGLETNLRNHSRGFPCTDSSCNKTSCTCIHIALPVKGYNAKQVATSTNINVADPNVPLIDIMYTDALRKLMEKPYPLLDKKMLQQVRHCSVFSLTQLCEKGSYCNNYHVLPPNFSRGFYAAVRIADLMKHVNSSAHFNAENYDVEARLKRTKNKSFDVGEATDYMMKTACRGCALILFDAFRNCSRRQGNNLLWGIMTRLHHLNKTASRGSGVIGSDDKVLHEMVQNTNNLLSLPHSNQLDATTTPIGTLCTKMTEAISMNLRRLRESHSHNGGFISANPASTVHVFWDFDNVLFADRVELSLFIQCLVSFVVLSGRATSMAAVNIKAFGTQQSFETDAVDTLRDMNVETILCSDKKAEETDRQIERSMRQVAESIAHGGAQGRNGGSYGSHQGGSGSSNTAQGRATFVLISSDKDFNRVTREVRGGHEPIDVIVVHSAYAASHHENMLHFSATNLVHVFDLYAVAMLRASGTAPNKQSAIHQLLRKLTLPPQNQQQHSSQPSHVEHHHADPAAVDSSESRNRGSSATKTAASGKGGPSQSSQASSSAFSSPSSRPGASASTSPPSDPHILDFFTGRQAAKALCRAPSASTAAAATTVSPSSVNAPSVSAALQKLLASNGAAVKTSSPPPAPVSSSRPLPSGLLSSGNDSSDRTLMDFIQLPRPSANNKAWYLLLADVYALRLRDRHNRGDNHGPFALEHYSEDNIRQEIRLFLEMAKLLPSFLPSWFDHKRAFQACYDKVTEEDPADWLSSESFVKLYVVDEFHEVHNALRAMAVLIDGPLDDMTGMLVTDMDIWITLKPVS